MSTLSQILILPQHPSLTLSFISFLPSSPQVTDKSLEAISNLCPSLEKISLWGCSRVTDKGLSVLISRCSNIKNFDLCSCDALTNKTLKALWMHPHVKILDVAGCFNISFAGIKELGKKKGSQLERISMGGVHGVSDKSFNELKVILPTCELSVLPQRSVPLDIRVR
jgi:hypothetical protein